MRFRDGADVDRALAALDHMLDELNGLRIKIQDFQVEAARKTYLNWADKAEREWRAYFVDPDVGSLLHTPRYWHLMQIVNDSQMTWLPLGIEGDVQAQNLKDLVETIKTFKTLADCQGEIVILDTNMYLHFKRFTDITADQWKQDFGITGKPVRLLVPLVILDELDQKKYNARDSKTNDRARKVLKAFDPFIGRASKPGGATVREDGVLLEILADEGGHQRRAGADDEIIDRARLISQVTGLAVNVVSNDTGMRVRATAQGLRAVKPGEEYRLPVAGEAAV